MHGIHHSIVPEETASNWSSGLTLWDWLHGTPRLNVPQEGIVGGAPAYRKPAEVTLPKVLAMPFEEQRLTVGGCPATARPRSRSRRCPCRGHAYSNRKRSGRERPPANRRVLP